jgi:PiT family inorganic phosphate transporter
MHNTVLLVVVVLTAVSFDFTNGFHDTANAMATSIATKALRPRIAVLLCGVLNFVGAFLSVKVAATIASGIVDQDVVTLPVVFAGLIGAIAWNVLTWFFGLPSSSSHALIGGVVGATAVAAGTHAVQGHNLVSKVIIPAVLSPIIAGLVAALATFMAYRVARPSEIPETKRTFRLGQLASASLVSLAHGTNDAQKTMGVITLALIADHRLGKDSDPPFWVILICALAIASGTYIGGWRVIRTMGHRLTQVEPPQGFVAETAAAAVLLISTRNGVPLSTTHITSGAVMGSGIGKRAADVRWGVAGRMVVAWIVTLPAAALVAALIAAITKQGGNAPILIVAVVAAALLAGVWWISRRDAVTADNVNDEGVYDELEPAGAGVGAPAVGGGSNRG